MLYHQTDSRFTIHTHIFYRALLLSILVLLSIVGDIPHNLVPLTELSPASLQLHFYVSTNYDFTRHYKDHHNQYSPPLILVAVSGDLRMLVLVVIRFCVVVAEDAVGTGKLQLKHKYTNGEEDD